LSFGQILKHRQQWNCIVRNWTAIRVPPSCRQLGRLEYYCYTNSG